MIRRPPRSTLSSSSAASDVYKRQVESRTELDLHWMPLGAGAHVVRANGWSVRTPGGARAAPFPTGAVPLRPGSRCRRHTDGDRDELAWIGFQPLEVVFGVVGAAVMILAVRSRSDLPQRAGSAEWRVRRSRTEERQVA